MSGWYLISRKLTDPFHDLHPHSTGETACSAWAWVDLIGMARWKESGGVPRGHIPASERFLATRWNWHRSRVTRFLDELEEKGRIEREPQTGRKPGHIIICNYDLYQEAWATTEATSEPREGPRTGPREGPKKKEEQPKNKKRALPDYSDDFEAVWKTHPRGSKKKAWPEYRKAVPKRIDHDSLLTALRSYVRSELQDDFKGVHLERWIRDDRWEEQQTKRNGVRKPSIYADRHNPTPWIPEDAR
jgi:hypothetical protein